MIIDDDLVARHRPTARLAVDERDDLVAAIVDPTSASREAADRIPTTDDIVAVLDPAVRLGSFARHRRNRWLPAAAAAVLVLACGAGVALWQSRDGATPAGSVRMLQTCTTTLPTSWRAARSATPLQVDGANASPQATAPDGRLLVSWDRPGSTVHYGLRAESGTVTPVASFPAGESDGPSVGGTDGHHVLFYNAGSTRADAVTLVDVASGTRVDVSGAAPVHPGWRVASDAVIQGGFVYWGSAPVGDDSHGVVVRYSIAHRTYRILAALKQFPTVVGDVRGVAWPGGRVPDGGVPSALEPLLDHRGEPVDRLVTDGDDYAWQLIKGDQRIFHWADTAGNTSTFVVRLGAGHDGAGLTAVSGPFLFLHVNQGGNSDYVLDTRTGAVAATGTELARSDTNGYLFLDGANADEHFLVDPAKLPALHC